MRIPIIIIGAPRSGTNMLRDLLCELDDLTTWPCDEINYIWRYGNRTYPNDQFPRSLATPKVRQFIQEQFAKRSKTRRIVEKTCANSLRVEFVNEIFPNAQYIFIVRDGQDAAVSAMLKSQKSIDLAYLWTKVSFVPVVDIPFYCLRYLVSRFRRMFSKTKIMKTWGPIPESGLQVDGKATALQMSAHQWAECVKQSKIQLDKLGNDRYLTVNYEEFVADPIAGLTRILEFINVSIPSNISVNLSRIKNDSIGKAHTLLSRSEKDSIRSIIDTVSCTAGYQGVIHD